MIAKYLATSLAILKVVRAPRVIKSCLPTSTTSISLVGLESRSTMLAASLAACVPVFMATPTSAWARAGASLVPSPVMATMRPPVCCSRMSFILVSGVACARKSSTPDSLEMAAAVSGLSPVIMMVRMPILRSSSKRARLLTCPIGTRLRFRDHQGRAAYPGNAIDDLLQFVVMLCITAVLCNVGGDRICRPIAWVRAVQVDAAHARHGREGDEGC